MDAIVEKLDTKLREWEPNTAAEVRKQIAEIIDLAGPRYPRYNASTFRRAGGSESNR